jgi:hypothetical protein
MENALILLTFDEVKFIKMNEKIKLLFITSFIIIIIIIRVPHIPRETRSGHFFLVTFLVI